MGASLNGDKSIPIYKEISRVKLSHERENRIKKIKNKTRRAIKLVILPSVFVIIISILSLAFPYLFLVPHFSIIFTLIISTVILVISVNLFKTMKYNPLADYDGDGLLRV